MIALLEEREIDRARGKKFAEFEEWKSALQNRYLIGELKGLERREKKNRRFNN